MILIGLVCCVPAMAEGASSRSEAIRAGGLGVIKGVVRDQAGSGIADATVAIFRVGTSKLLKQVRSASDGSFIAKIIPGTYTVLAVAEGFNPVTLASVDVARSAELVYGFKLIRAGGGNTLAEKALDRNGSKWRVRAANMQRTIFQNVEGKTPAGHNRHHPHISLRFRSKTKATARPAHLSARRLPSTQRPFAGYLSTLRSR